MRFGLFSTTNRRLATFSFGLALTLSLAFLTASSALADLTGDWSSCQSGPLGGREAKNPTSSYGQYCLGLAYLTGYFGQKDYPLAAQWWEKAAAQNHAGAEVALGYMYEKGRGEVNPNPPRALELYQRAAEQGSADALFNLGRLYKDGTAVTANMGTAEEYFKKASALGSEEARKMLLQTNAPTRGPVSGQTEFDQGVVKYKAQQFEDALRLFMASAQAGNARAQLQVASQYERGEGVPQNFEEAVRWYSQSANAGDPQAMKNLGQLFENGQGVRENWTQAAALYAKSAEAAYRDGEFALGRAYQFGIGVPQNRGLAIEWFRRAATLGHAQAAYFAKWLGTPSNNVGFRNDEEHALVIGSKLRFAGDLLGADPTGQLFRNSSERTAYLLQLSKRADLTEATTMWSIKKSEYDSCIRNHGESCRAPGTAPGQ